MTHAMTISNVLVDGGTKNSNLCLTFYTKNTPIIKKKKKNYNSPFDHWNIEPMSIAYHNFHA